MDKEGYYIMIQGSIHQENITTLNLYHLISELQYTWSKKLLGSINYLDKLHLK